MLTKRLLAAARHAYQIDGDGVVPDQGWTPAPYGYVGYTDQPMAFEAGQDNQDAGFVATIPEGVVIAIRGTTPPSLAEKLPQQVVVDWACDALAGLVAAAGDPPGFPGRVHLGFYKSFMRLWEKLGLEAHARINALGPGAPVVFVTGHSKGGAICALLAWRLKIDFPQAKIVVRSFAGARVGDDAFAAAYNQAISDHIRYEYDDDIVPHLPLSPEVAQQLGVPKLACLLLTVADVGYGEVGQLGYIQVGGAIVGDSPGLEEQRLQALITRVVEPNGFKYIIDCHGVDPPSDGYYIGQYPD